MEQENVKRHFTDKAYDFDAIYSKKVSPLMRFLNRLFRWDIIARMKMAYERLSREDIQSIVDIGCGAGRLALELAKRGKDVVGIDFSAKMVDIADALKAKEGVENVKFICSDILQYQLDAMADATVALGFFDYTQDPSPFLEKTASFTKDLFIATFPRRGTGRALFRRIRLAVFGCPVYFYEQAQIETLLKEVRFKVTKCTIVGQLYFVEARKYTDEHR